MLLCAIGTTNKVRRHAGYIIHDWLTFAALPLRRRNLAKGSVKLNGSSVCVYTK